MTGIIRGLLLPFAGALLIALAVVIPGVSARTAQAPATVELATPAANVVMHPNAGGTTPFQATFGLCPGGAIWIDHHHDLSFMTDAGFRISATRQQVKQFAMRTGEAVDVTVTPPGARTNDPDRVDTVTATTWQLSSAQTQACAPKPAVPQCMSTTYTTGSWIHQTYFSTPTMTVTVNWTCVGGKITSYTLAPPSSTAPSPYLYAYGTLNAPADTVLSITAGGSFTATTTPPVTTGSFAMHGTCTATTGTCNFTNPGTGG